MEDNTKKRTAVWLTPTTIEKIDAWLQADNCKTRSEFIEKSLHFYMGFLSSEDVSEYLCKALVDTLRGIVDDNENRMRCLIFKWAVELNMMTHTVAAHFGDAVEDQRELRRYAVDEVKRTNGQGSFDKALVIQRQLRGDEWLG